MPRVKLQTPIATKDRSYHAGTVVDVPAELAKAWVKNGNATFVRGGDAETPERGGRENTSRRSSGARRGAGD